MRPVTLPTNFRSYDWQKLCKKEKNGKLAMRYFAFSLLARGYNVLDTASVIKRSPRMVHRWISYFIADGIDGLKDKEGRGRKHLVSDNELDKLKDAIKHYEQTVQRTVIAKDVQLIITTLYGKTITLPTAYNLMRRTGIEYNAYNIPAPTPRKLRTRQ